MPQTLWMGMTPPDYALSGINDIQLAKKQLNATKAGLG